MPRVPVHWIAFAVPLALLGACTQVAGLGDLVFEGEGGSSASTTASAGGSGGRGGEGGTGGTQRCDPDQCIGVSECAESVCINDECVSVPFAVNTACDLTEFAEGTCDGAGDCVECITTTDCVDVGAICDAGVCVPPQCENQVQDGSETAIDCGGEDCAPCPNGDACLENSDCATRYCNDQQVCDNCSGLGPGVCSAGFYCENSSSCEPQKGLGQGCQDDTQCLSECCAVFCFAGC